MRCGCVSLQSIGEGLVHLGDLGRNAKIDGTVADFNDETADDVRVDLLISLVVVQTKRDRGEIVPWGQP